MNGDVKEACQRAVGYLDLGMTEEALAELEEVPAAPAVLHLQVEILFRLKRWSDAAEICLPMLKREPSEPAWWIQAAFAVRRAESVEAAEPLLREALQHHPQHPLIIFNLACYACVQGRHQEARELLERAMEGDGREILELAENDPDLSDILPWIQQRAADNG